MAYIVANKQGHEFISDEKPFRMGKDKTDDYNHHYTENEDGTIIGLDYDKFGDQRIPASFEDLTCWGWDCKDNIIELPKGSIKKLIGRDLKYEDNPVELIVDNPCELY